MSTHGPSGGGAGYPLSAPVYGHLAADVILLPGSGGVTTIVTLFTTPSLAVGKWMVNAGILVMISNGAGGQPCEFTIATGTATATFDGQYSTLADSYWVPLNGVGTTLGVSINGEVTVTAPGTIKIVAQNLDTVGWTAKAKTMSSSGGGGDYFGATGYIATQVA